MGRSEDRSAEQETLMATFYGQGRTNTFAVKDVEALKAALSDTDIEVLDVGSHFSCRILK